MPDLMDEQQAVVPHLQDYLTPSLISLSFLYHIEKNINYLM